MKYRVVMTKARESWEREAHDRLKGAILLTRM